MEEMETIIVKVEDSGTRIDKFLVKEFFLYSRGEIIRKIKKGEAKVNNKIVKPSYLLENDDSIELENFSKEGESKEILPNDQVPLEIIYENQDFLVINKQAGVQVHPSIIEKKQTIVNALLARYPQIKDVHDGSEGSELRPGIVHRLDKDTSGVMVIAKNMRSLDLLKQIFQNRKAQKIYLAIAHGIFDVKEGEIEKPLAKSADYSKQVVARSNTKTTIREAVTKYKVIDESNDFSLVQAFPKTGRTHQIRIHLASVGHSIAGDLIYGRDKKDGAKRQMLHALALEFEFGGQKYSLKAKEPQDFADFWKSVKSLK